MSKSWQNSEPAVPLIPTHPSTARVRVDCPYCDKVRQVRGVDQLQECGCGGQYHCEYPYDAHSQIYDRGFPRKAPAWWTANKLRAYWPEEVVVVAE